MSSGYRNRAEATYANFTPGDNNIEPATFETGDPIILGQRPGIAMTNRDEETSRVTIMFNGTFDNVSVYAETAIEHGQILYFSQDGFLDTHLTDVSHGNIRWGYSDQATGSSGLHRIKVVVGY